MKLFRFFKNPFLKKAMLRLIDYGHAQLMALTADNPGGVHATRIAAMTAAFALLDDGMEDVETKAAIQGGKVTAKNLFRTTTVPETVTRLHAAVVLNYGAESADMAECFPHGREVFRSCKDQELDDHLGQLHTALAARTATIGAPLVAQAAGLETTWATCIGQVGGATGDVGLVRAARQNAKRAFADELFLTLLHLAATYPDDEVKFAQYVPEQKLNPPQAQPPGAPEITATGAEGAINLASECPGADIMHCYRRAAGTSDPWVEMGSGAVGEELLFESIPPGNYDVMARGENAQGLGEESNVVTVTVS